MGSSQSTPAPSKAAFNEKQPCIDRPTTHVALPSLEHLALDESDGSLTLARLPDWEHAVSDDPAKRLARTIIAKTNINEALLDPAVVNQPHHVFNTKVPLESKHVTNQKSSGRCWLFALTNCIRQELAKKYNLDTFELSQSYLFYYDKLEKANYFLENTIDLAEEPLSDRRTYQLLSDPISDGGQWDMAVNLVEKVGIVPQAVYPESFNSSNSGKLDSLLSSKLREYAVQLRASYQRSKELAHARFGASRSADEKHAFAVKATRAIKAKQLEEIYTILSISLGSPPEPNKTFEWSFHDKDGKYKSVSATPLEFYKLSGFDAGHHISLVHDPRHAPYQLLTVDRLGSVWNGRPVKYVNAQIEDLKSVVVALIKAGRPVWFGCDVGKSSSTVPGLMVDGLYNLQDAFGTSLGMSKTQRLDTGESAMTHAMVFTGVHLDDDGKPVRFRVENSWSDSYGDKGYFSMSAAWFDEYVYQVVAPRSVVPKKFKEIYERASPKVLPLWDPFGSLATA